VDNNGVLWRRPVEPTLEHSGLLFLKHDGERDGESEKT
jgi:hypothetical protein